MQLGGAEVSAGPLTLFKYGILDVTFRAEGIIWEPADAPGIALRRECGFVGHAPEDFRLFGLTEEHRTCLEDLRNEISGQGAWIRLFLREDSSRLTKRT